MADDSELLRRYVGTRDEAAFAELVRRYLNLVYFAALRQVGGDAHRAEDVTQNVFTLLARKASALTRHQTLAGWLHTTTRFAASEALRTERRRLAREQEAHTMHELSTDPAANADWEQLRPVIDEALNDLGDADREAVLLRFFANLPFAEMGAKLNLSENTARMRVERALEKLRALLSRRGLTSTSVALSAALAEQAAAAAPSALAATVTGAALAGTGAVGAGAATFMASIKLQLGVAGALVAAGTIGAIIQSQANATLRVEIATLHRQTAAVAGLRAEIQRLGQRTAEVEALRRDDAEFARLRDEVTTVKTRQTQAVRAEVAARASHEATLLAQPVVPEDLILLGRRDADEADEAFALKGAENFKGSGVPVPRAGPGVKLEEIELVRPKVGAAGGHVFAEIFFRVAILGAVVGRRRPFARGGRSFCGDEDAFGFAGCPTVAEDLGDELFAAAVAVAGGRVDEVAAEVERAVERGERIGVGLRAPRAADGPGAEADLGAVEGMLAERAEVHLMRCIADSSHQWCKCGPKADS